MLVVLVLAPAPELVGHHTRHLELVAAAAALALHGHADPAGRCLRGVQPQQEDGALAQLVVAIYQRVLALAAAGAPAEEAQKRQRQIWVVGAWLR